MIGAVKKSALMISRYHRQGLIYGRRGRRGVIHQIDSTFAKNVIKNLLIFWRLTDEKRVDKYDLEYKGVRCYGVQWKADPPLFAFIYEGRDHIFEQTRYISQTADTDHIRCAIDQFLEVMEKEREKMKYIRYRFKTKAVDDYRPLEDMAEIKCPWWCSGEGNDFVVIVCYLPKGVDLKKYWDDAYEIVAQAVESITYTDRFPKPDWLESEGEE